jgi:hypothetical protein
MKSYAVAASLAAGFFIFSGAASAQVGTVSANYSRMEFDDNIFAPDDLDEVAIDGAVAFQTGGDTFLQIDGAYSTADEADLDLISLGGHWGVRRGDIAYAGFAGFGRSEYPGGDSNIWGVGGEFAKFFDRSTLVLAAGWATAGNAPFSEDIEILGLTGEYRFFATDNLRFDVRGGWADIKEEFSGDDGTYIGAGVEWRLPSTPMSIGADYKHLDIGSAGNSNTFGATLRFDFGSQSLKDRDRRGNTFTHFGGLLNFLQ